MSLIDAGPVDTEGLIGAIPFMIIVVTSIWLMKEVWYYMGRNKNEYKNLLIFIGGIIVLISSIIPTMWAADMVMDNGYNENSALLAALTAGSIYMVIMAFLYGKYVIYPNEESTNGA